MYMYIHGSACVHKHGSQSYTYIRCIVTKTIITDIVILFSPVRHSTHFSLGQVGPPNVQCSPNQLLSQ